MGKSGSGKSTSLRNCQDFAVFNVLGKPLPFKNRPKTMTTDDYNVILKGLSKCKAQSVVIDDAGYLTDTDEFGNIKPKSIGKLLDEKVCIEGLFTIVLHSKYDDGKYVFSTKTNGADVAKTPLEMFDSAEIDNDLKMVDNTIREYYGLNENSNQEENKNAEAE